MISDFRNVTKVLNFEDKKQLHGPATNNFIISKGGVLNAKAQMESNISMHITQTQI